MRVVVECATQSLYIRHPGNVLVLKNVRKVRQDNRPPKAEPKPAKRKPGRPKPIKRYSEAYKKRALALTEKLGSSFRAAKKLGCTDMAIRYWMMAERNAKAKKRRK